MKVKHTLPVNGLFLVVFLLLSVNASAQSGFPKYIAFYQSWQRADSCYTAGDYLNAAKFFTLAATAEIEKGLEVPREEIWYSVAAAYALAGKEKQALKVLQNLASVDQFEDIVLLSADSAFIGIHHKKAWARLSATVQDNYSRSLKNKATYKARTQLTSPSDQVIFYPHPNDFIRELLNQDTLPFLSVDHGNFRIYFSGDSYAAGRIPEINEAVTAAFNRGLELLQTEAYHRGITLVLFNSPEEMKDATGVRALGGIAYAELDAGLFPITATRRPQFKHEIFHILSLNIWGDSHSRLLIEGSAVYADYTCHVDNPFFTINAYYLQTNQLVSFDALIHHFDDIAVKNDVLAYLQSAAIFQYLYENYGVEKMKLLWQSGFDSFEKIYGFTLAQLEKEWLEYLQTIPVPVDFEPEKLKEGCG